MLGSLGPYEASTKGELAFQAVGSGKYRLAQIDFDVGFAFFQVAPEAVRCRIAVWTDAVEAVGLRGNFHVPNGDPFVLEGLHGAGDVFGPIAAQNAIVHQAFNFIQYVSGSRRVQGGAVGAIKDGFVYQRLRVVDVVVEQHAQVRCAHAALRAAGDPVYSELAFGHVVLAAQLEGVQGAALVAV